MNAEELLRAWDEAHESDRAASWIASDRKALGDASALRLLFLELVSSSAEAETDLYHACIRLGATLAELGASPTLAGVALDGARVALDAAGRTVPELTWRAARAALVEGYVRWSRDEVERASFASWEPPRCFVVVERELAAVTAGHPSTDADVLAPWAGRVAGALLVRGVRRALVGGDGKAAAAVLQALTDAGIAATAVAPGTTERRSRS